MRRVMRVIHGVVAGAAILILGACTTTSPSKPNPATPTESTDVIPVPRIKPVPIPPAPSPSVETPTTPPSAETPPEPLSENAARFAQVEGWAEADHAPALAAFRRSCEELAKRPDEKQLHSKNDWLGTHADWSEVCRAAKLASNATPFFETLFAPVSISPDAGLLTGYYEPEVEVRAAPDAIFSEPILSVPDDDAVRALPRAKLTAKSADVIAYGRPIDVFFLHIQGSGRLHFDDGRVVRAGYAANNGHKYRSIGRVLINRGALTKEQSAKRNIQAWMDEAGPEKTRELMNANPRYIFFSEQTIPDGDGPKGAMQVPLTAMGSIAVDPKHNPYGIPVFLNTRLPQKARDYRGEATGLLVVTQDTGGAIKGPLRGDLFFGAGNEAGALAGVMKHPVRWTVLVPIAVAARLEAKA